jgi:hypothetical protein
VYANKKFHLSKEGENWETFNERDDGTSKSSLKSSGNEKERELPRDASDAIKVSESKLAYTSDYESFGYHTLLDLSIFSTSSESVDKWIRGRPY